MGAKEKEPEEDVGTGVCSDDDEDIGGSPGNETDGFFSFRLLSSSSSPPASPTDGLSVSKEVLVCAVSVGFPKLNENELDDAGAAKSVVVFSTLAVPNENGAGAAVDAEAGAETGAGPDTGGGGGGAELEVDVSEFDIAC